MRILVLKRRPVPQPASCLQRLFDFRIRVDDYKAAEELDRIEEMAGRSNRRRGFQAVFHSGVEIVGAMARSRVDCARPRIERDVFSKHSLRVALVDRVAKTDALQLRAFESGDRAIESSA